MYRFRKYKRLFAMISSFIIAITFVIVSFTEETYAYASLGSTGTLEFVRSAIESGITFGSREAMDNAYGQWQRDPAFPAWANDVLDRTNNGVLGPLDLLTGPSAPTTIDKAEIVRELNAIGEGARVSGQAIGGMNYAGNNVANGLIMGAVSSWLEGMKDLPGGSRFKFGDVEFYATISNGKLGGGFGQLQLKASGGYYAKFDDDWNLKYWGIRDYKEADLISMEKVGNKRYVNNTIYQDFSYKISANYKGTYTHFTGIESVVVGSYDGDVEDISISALPGVTYPTHTPSISNNNTRPAIVPGISISGDGTEANPYLPSISWDSDIGNKAIEDLIDGLVGVTAGQLPGIIDSGIIPIPYPPGGITYPPGTVNPPIPPGTINPPINPPLPPGTINPPIDIPINPPINIPIDPSIPFPPFPTIDVSGVTIDLSGIIAMLKAILQFLSDFMGWLGNVFMWILQKFFEMFMNMMAFLFIPKPEYLPNQFDSLKLHLSNKFGDSSTEVFEMLQSVQDSKWEDIKINLFGKEATIVSASFINSVAGTLRPWVNGFFMIMLVLYNYNQIYFLIRGTYPISSGIIKNSSNEGKKE